MAGSLSVVSAGSSVSGSTSFSESALGSSESGCTGLQLATSTIVSDPSGLRKSLASVPSFTAMPLIVVQDRSADVLSVEIEDFPNEDGWFMLWELSIADDRRSTRVVPVFVNDRLVLRPIAGRRIMDALLRPGVRLTVGTASNADAETWARLEELSQDFAYNDFKDLSERHEKATRENHDKYAYALELRREAAQRVGIENIRAAKLARIEAEQAEMEVSYAKERQVLPEFRCMLLVRLVES